MTRKVLTGWIRDFQDAMGKTWDKDKIASLLLAGFAPGYDNDEDEDEDGAIVPSIDVLITFDRHGVSSHSNHISLYHGAREFVKQLAELDPDGDESTGLVSAPVALYTLTTVGLLRKYSGILDVFATLAERGRSSMRAKQTKKDVDDDGDEDAKQSPPDSLVFALPLGGARSAVSARAPMLRAHVSQMVWFRYGWIYLSRYMFINSLKLES